jgi:uncharacterized protein (TIGR03067 family)
MGDDQGDKMSLKLRVIVPALLLVAFGTVLWVATPKSDDSIMGTWQAVSAQALGKRIDDGDDGKEIGMWVTFAEGKATWNFETADGRRAYDGYCRIDPDGHTGWIDLGEPQSQDPTRVALGIYRIDGKTLYINMGDTRPSDFDQPALAKLKLKRVR